MNDDELAVEYTQAGNEVQLYELLTKNNNLVHSKDWSGDSLLSIACWYGYLNIAKTLIEKYDFDVNHRNSLGITPLHRACSGNHIELALFLYQRGASTNIKDKVCCYSPTTESFHSSKLFYDSQYIYEQLQRFCRMERRASITEI